MRANSQEECRACWTGQSHKLAWLLACAPLQDVERLGANIAANASREQMSYTVDCLKSGLPVALELLADAVLNPAFHAEVRKRGGGGGKGGVKGR